MKRSVDSVALGVYPQRMAVHLLQGWSSLLASAVLVIFPSGVMSNCQRAHSEPGERPLIEMAVAV